MDESFLGTISCREGIRFLPEDFTEPTSTVVLTTPKSAFVDLRFILEQDGTLPAKSGETRKLDWGIGGFSHSAERESSNGTPYSHSWWMHWIDSRQADAVDLTDDADMFPQPDDVFLEIGSMVNPATGKEGKYEELWRDERVQGTMPLAGQRQGRDNVTVRLELGDMFDNLDLSQATPQWKTDPDGSGAEDRGMVIMMGKYCQGIRRTREQVVVERWERTASGDGKDDWQRVAKLGEGELPCAEVIRRGSALKLGDSIEASETKTDKYLAWTVREVAASEAASMT